MPLTAVKCAAGAFAHSDHRVGLIVHGGVRYVFELPLEKLGIERLCFVRIRAVQFDVYEGVCHVALLAGVREVFCRRRRNRNAGRSTGVPTLVKTALFLSGSRSPAAATPGCGSTCSAASRRKARLGYSPDDAFGLRPGWLSEITGMAWRPAGRAYEWQIGPDQSFASLK